MVKPKGNIWSYYRAENGKVKCIFCGNIFYKNATRLAKHLFKCFKAPAPIKKQFKNRQRKNETETNIEVEGK